VGWAWPGAPPTLLIAEVWNGQAWSLTTLPEPPGASQTTLTGVSCASATACIAVGNYTTTTNQTVALAEQFNGVGWSLQSPANGTNVSLAAASCPSSSSTCTAVGQQLDPTTGSYLTAAELWSGTSWTPESTPNPSGATSNALNGVSCVTSAACTAVGSDSGASASAQALGESWNGTSWTVQPVAAPSGSQLTGVSCATSNFCVAVGYDGTILAEGWNGSVWSTQSTSAIPGIVRKVSCPSTTLCVAVGSAPQMGTPMPLAARYS
jgi:hypothetical protein